MDREEAIEQLQNCKELIFRDGKDWLDERDIPLLDMAIEALSADAVQGVGRYENAMQKLRDMPRYLNGVKEKQITKTSANYTTKKPNDEVEQKNDVIDTPTDLISRADAIGAVCSYCVGEPYPKCNQKQYCEEVKALLALPSADIVRCKDCRYKEYDITHNFCEINYHKCYDDDYCPWGERKEE